MINVTTNHQHGFTILELLIATTVFSVILLLITFGIINIGNAYYKGANQSRTQTVARNIIDEISRGIQFSGSDVQQSTSTGPSGKYYFCANGTMYSYVIDKQLGSSGTDKTLIAQDGLDCVTGNKDVASANGRELLTKGMRLLELNVQPGASPNTYNITVSIGVGGDTGDLFDPAYYPSQLDKTRCKSGAGSQYCAVSKLNTTVVKRVK